MTPSADGFAERRRGVVWWKKILDRWEFIVFVIGAIVMVANKNKSLEDAIRLGQQTAARVDTMEPTLAALKQGQDDLINYFGIRKHQ